MMEAREVPQEVLNNRLLLAAKDGSIEQLECLIQEGADVNACSTNDGPVLTIATVNGYLHCMAVLLSAGADVNTRKINRPVIIEAARKGMLHAVGLLVEAGADVNRKNKFGNTALMAAAQAKSSTLVGLLIEAGADVNTKVAGSSSLQIVAKNGMTESVQLLVCAGADVNMLDSCGKSPLWYLIQENHDPSQAMDCMINAGADVNVKIDGSSLLHIAAKRGMLKGVHQLVRAGADVNIPDGNFKTALMYVVEKTSDPGQTAEFLIDAGAGVNSMDNNGNMPLDLAVRAYNSKCLQVLLNAGCEIYKEFDNNKITFENQRSRDMYTFLVAAGMKPDIENFSKWLCSDNTSRSRSLKFLRSTLSFLELKNLCRTEVRKHLMSINSVNLFTKVPRLGLPSILVEFLLFNVSLETAEETNKGLNLVERVSQIIAQEEMRDRALMDMMAAEFVRLVGRDVNNETVDLLRRVLDSLFLEYSK